MKPALLSRPLFSRLPALGLGSLCLVGALGLPPAVAAEGGPSAPRARELVHLVRQDCGSCHGLTLKGGLGPALTAETFRQRPAESMVATILYGRPGTPMPPFKGIVSEAEAEWIVQQLQAGFPTE